MKVRIRLQVPSYVEYEVTANTLAAAKAEALVMFNADSGTNEMYSVFEDVAYFDHEILEEK